MGESTMGTKKATRNRSRARSPRVFRAWAISRAAGTAMKTLTST